MKDYKSHILTTTTLAAQKLVNFKQGFMLNSDTEYNISSDDIWIGPRNVLEHDSNFKHIIPYIVIKQNDKYLTYQRTSSGGESRLHGNFSIGFGGHVDCGDIVLSEDKQQIDFFKTIFFSAKRELSEELSIIIDEDCINIIGYLYDDSNSVGLVHLGLVVVVEVNDAFNVSSPEDQINLQGFKSVSELSIDKSAFENWSVLLIEHFKNIGI